MALNGQAAGMTGHHQRSLRMMTRLAAVMSLDCLAAGLSLGIAVTLRVGDERAAEYLAQHPIGVPLFTIVAAGVFLILGLPRRAWRFSSISDGIIVVEAASLAIIAFWTILWLIGLGYWLPRSVAVIQWLVLIAAMGGMRSLRRVLSDFSNGRALHPEPLTGARERRRVLLIGDCATIEQVLRRLEQDIDAAFEPLGIIDDGTLHDHMRVRGVQVLGSINDLPAIVAGLRARGLGPECLLYTGAQSRLQSIASARLVADAQSLNIKVAYLPSVTELKIGERKQVDLRYLNISDLLDRPQVDLDNGLVASAIRGRRVLVTGAGGTIGRELVRQIARYAPSRLLMLDASELGLYEVDLEMREHYPELQCVPVLCSIRQRQHVMRVFEQHRPELVFHAAALKHVPLVELHAAAGIQTNVIGTRNVADAALHHGAMAMVQVSTDKAVNPVGFMGMTKRLAELYCQALDLAGRNKPDAPRFMTVRFGNVLGSSGSLIPLLQRQLSQGGPLTVTHPQMERFFMTVDEAVQLVLHSAARGLHDDSQRGRIFVLDMGHSVRIIDIARRMIRLAGLEPEVDVGIKIVGLRPGEKLYEELFDSEELQMPSSMPRVFEAEPAAVPMHVLQEVLAPLEVASASGDDARCVHLVSQFLAPPERKRVAMAGVPRPADFATGNPMPIPSSPAFGPASRPYRPIIAGVSANGAGG
jgi:FlaA1/EpsC-like NDP-sugar epimerase